MPHFNILKNSNLPNTYRTQAILGTFDLQPSQIGEHFEGNIEIEDKDWKVGLIVGSSGTGKTTIAKEIFGDDIFHGGGSIFKGDKPVVEEMPEGRTIQEISQMFCSVGFASVPNWLRPYSVLSNGEKMRCDLAYALLSDRHTIVYDEFTSVVNREVAKVSSMAIRKAVNRMDKKFIAISCHDDIIDWLQPDWIYNTDEKRFFFAKAKLKDQNSKSEYMKLGTMISRGNYGMYLANIII